MLRDHHNPFFSRPGIMLRVLGEARVWQQNSDGVSLHSSRIGMRWKVMDGGLGANPFGILTFIVAPAILTNASTVIALGTSNRFARAIDRARALSSQVE